MKVFNSRKNWYKDFFQIAILLILVFIGIRLWLDKTYAPDFEAYCPLGGLQALGSYLTRGSLACTMTSAQIMMGIILIVGIIFFSKLFCGYICPLGTVGEWLGKLGDKFKIRSTIQGWPDKALRLLKYGLLFATFYFTLQSSELFCKKFDPYYAVTSGFDTDVELLWAIGAILVLVLGSVFLRLFWCKYLCPLGAASNIFKFWWWFAGILGIYIVIILLGTSLHWVWPLAVITAGGFILEVWRMKKAGPGLVHITRNKETCIDCNLCSKNCPQGIDVASVEKVEHVDCNLCGDCITACPETNTLQINSRNMRWLPATVLTVLIVAGIILGTRWELPTIDEKWGTKEQIEQAGIFTQEGLKNIKCFGSASAFANQMRTVKGIYGVAAYVGNHSVKIYYDKNVFEDEEEIQKLLFTPAKRVIRPIGQEVNELEKYTTTVDKFFDPMDVYYLQQLMLQKSKAVAFETKYACPVIIHFYYPAGEAPSVEELEEIIESRTLTYTASGQEFHVKLNYELMSFDENPVILSRTDYIRAMYTPTVMKFNKFSSFTEDVLRQYRISMEENRALRSRYSYLISHLSNDEGVVAFETWLDSLGTEMASIVFVDTLTTAGQIDAALRTDSLRVTYSGGRTGVVENPFTFSGSGETADYPDNNLNH